MAAFDDLPFDILTENILPLVGIHQYRFVGGVNRTFCEAYTTLFSKATSFTNVSTMEQASHTMP
jgi:hypothetical protein